ncbi:Lrp/AsnC family transcriptional regulator [Haloprofundus halobius]|uniref:Lrp/AsnC family transcriptional regulator n=1 Tax=Haloprofundus halobius TaxID=2876194 RepID=UPI001CCAEF9E|nr:Lrp/AsnC family transcriptional regulator [Haloprofundus halobius]
MSDRDLDAVDRGIIYLLQQDARRTITDIAETVNVSANTVRNRIDRLESRGVIEGYSVDVDFNKTHSQHYYQFVCTTPVSDREERVEEILSIDGILKVRTLMTGTRNLLVTAVGETSDEITDIAKELDSRDHVDIEFEDLIRIEKCQPLSKYNIKNITN